MPTIGDDDALLRVSACGLCGTDHEQYTGELSGGFAFVPGHETVGTIEAIGPKAARRWGVAAGDRVAVEVFQSCRDCAACRTGEYRRCERHGLADMYGFIPVERQPGLWGGYAEYQYRYPFADLPRRCAGLDAAEDLLAAMAGERDGVPPVDDLSGRQGRSEDWVQTVQLSPADAARTGRRGERVYLRSMDEYGCGTTI